MLSKRVPIVHFKALTDDNEPAGTFEAIVAVFDNIDLYGEVVERGAFKEALAEDWPKLVWSHMWNQPPIGVTLDIKEVEKGVYAKGRLFVGEGEDSPLARQVWTAMKATDGKGAAGIDEFSYHYVPIDGGIEDRDGERVYTIRKASMTEWGPCLKGVNPETELISVKGVDPLEVRRRELPGYDPAEITAAQNLKADTAEANPPANSPEDEEPAARATEKAVDVMFAVPPAA